LRTLELWYPKKVASLTTSRHQTYITVTTNKTPNKLKKPPILWKWKYKTEPVVKYNAAIEETKGQGLGVTIWNKCFWPGAVVCQSIVVLKKLSLAFKLKKERIKNINKYKQI